MPTRIPASERTSQKLDELLTQGVADGDARAELLKLAVRKIVEEALEAEVADAVGRGYYENGAPPGAGYRNGYRRGRLATAEGPIEYGVPQVADRAEPFASRLRAGLAGRTAELERLAVEMFARGLSTRDIEAAFRDASGASVLSRTAVSQVFSFSSPNIFSDSTSEKPMMAFSGVRNSWDMLARNSDLCWLAAESSRFAASNSLNNRTFTIAITA